MAEREHKSLDDFFAKRDKKKKKDKGRGGKAPPAKAVVAAAPPQPQPPTPPPPPPTPPVAEPEALPAQPAPASAPQHDQAPAPAPAPAQDAAPAPAPAPAQDAEQGQAQAQAQAEGAEQGPQLNPTPPAAAAPAAAVTTAPATATGGVRKPRKERERLAKGENQDPMQERPREDEEWKEFEQKEVDYSGLRIHALQISDEREEEDEKKEDQDEDGENVSYREGDRTIGPWNKITPAQAPVAVVEEVPEVKPTGVYRPPGARLGNARRTQSQGPPEIFNDVQFPSLQASAKHVETRKCGWPTVDDEDRSRELPHSAVPEVEDQ